jgi:hypothetical protein
LKKTTTHLRYILYTIRGEKKKGYYSNLTMHNKTLLLLL